MNRINENNLFFNKCFFFAFEKEKTCTQQVYAIFRCVLVIMRCWSLWIFCAEAVKCYEKEDKTRHTMLLRAKILMQLLLIVFVPTPMWSKFYMQINVCTLWKHILMRQYDIYNEGAHDMNDINWWNLTIPILRN